MIKRNATSERGATDHGLRSTGHLTRPIERAQQRRDVVAVDLVHPPAERAPLLSVRLDLQDQVAIGLNAIDVEFVHQVVKALRRGEHRRLPGGALLDLSVGHEVEDARRVALQAEPDRQARRHTKAVRE